MQFTNERNMKHKEIKENNLPEVTDKHMLSLKTKTKLFPISLLICTDLKA